MMRQIITKLFTVLVHLTISQEKRLDYINGSRGSGIVSKVGKEGGGRVWH